MVKFSENEARLRTIVRFGGFKTSLKHSHVSKVSPNQGRFDPQMDRYPRFGSQDYHLFQWDVIILLILCTSSRSFLLWQLIFGTPHHGSKNSWVTRHPRNGLHLKVSLLPASGKKSFMSETYSWWTKSCNSKKRTFWNGLFHGVYS